MKNNVLTVSFSGISISFPVRKDTKTPFLAAEPWESFSSLAGLLLSESTKHNKQ